MPFTTPDGIDHPESYWKVTSVTLDNDSATILFLGYHDKATRDTDKSAISKKDFYARGDDFTEYFSTDVLNQEGVNPKKQAYEYIDGKGTFFSGAENV